MPKAAGGRNTHSERISAMATNPTGVEATKTPAIEVAEKQLEKSIFLLSEIASALETGLVSVMNLPETCETSGKISVEVGVSPLAIALRKYTNDIDAISDRLTTLLRRLEI